MVKLKVMTVIGTRPEIIRLSKTIEKLDQFTDQVIVHTGQNYDFELNQVFFDDLNVRRPDHFLGAAGKSPSQTIANVIVGVDELLAAEQPDAMLVLGDTNSCLAVLPAKRHKVPVFHMEAGNRCYDQRVPEEINRRIIDHTADVNLAYSEIAKGNLLREGLPPDLVFKTGSPMKEILDHHKKSISASTALTRLDLSEGEYFLVSMHREENVDSVDRLLLIVDLLDRVCSRYGLPVIVSTHPRTLSRLNEHGISFNPLVRLLKPLGFFDYNRLQIGAKAVLSDSGTISEESSILNFRALNLRETHERQEAMEEGSVMMVGLSADRVMQGLAILENQNCGESRLLECPADYNVANVSEKVVRIILSYTDYVNRTVWKRY